MKIHRREFDIFNLSFLDIISCGFGAVIMLILIAQPNEDPSVTGTGEIRELLTTIINLQNTVASIKQTIADKMAKIKKLQQDTQQLQGIEKHLRYQIKQQQDKQQSLATEASGLALLQTTLKQASIATPERPVSKRDIEVGGIPVDSDYVIFIVDTSGSMQQIWGRVSEEIVNVLNIHPQVKGFQVLNDMGKSLVSGYDGKWMLDTARRRKNVIKLFGHWKGISNSSPVEGLRVALRKYAKPNITTSIYVFGDDYTGSSYDQVINSISRQNTPTNPQKKLARIHAVGFISPGTTDRFGILMRELTKRNAGTFLALPL